MTPQSTIARIKIKNSSKLNSKIEEPLYEVVYNETRLRHSLLD